MSLTYSYHGPLEADISKIKVFHSQPDPPDINPEIISLDYDRDDHYFISIKNTAFATPRRNNRKNRVYLNGEQAEQLLLTLQTLLPLYRSLEPVPAKYAEYKIPYSEIKTAGLFYEQDEDHNEFENFLM